MKNDLNVTSLDYIKEQLTDEFNAMIKEYNSFANDDEKLTMDRPLLNTNINYESIAGLLEKVLGIYVLRDQFTWKRDAYGAVFYYYHFTIGTKDIELSDAKSLRCLIDEIMVAIVEALLEMRETERLTKYISNNGLAYMPQMILQEFATLEDVHEFIKNLENSCYCDDEFESTLEKLGYQVKKGSFHGMYDITELRYIEVDDWETKIWLDVLYQPYTFYCSCKPRLRSDVLYILLELKSEEFWPGTEY